MAENQTKLANLIDPEVMAPMISAKLQSAIVATPFAKIDTTLQGQAGSTITVPKYAFIGDAEDLAEGADASESQLTATTATYTVKKAVKQVRLTDEAVLSGYGNPVGETNNQLGLSLASKVDQDVMDELKGATLVADKTAGVISYNGIVEAIDLFQEEENVEKVMFISPSQVSTLRKDSNFISNDKYNNNVIMRGEIGMVANTRIVPSKKINKVEYDIVASTTTGATKVTASNISTYQGKTKVPVKIDDYVLAASTAYYANPIVELRPEEQTGDETAAVTIYLKRNANVETERKLGNYTTLIAADEHYVAALTDESKVVVAQFATVAS